MGAILILVGLIVAYKYLTIPTGVSTGTGTPAPSPQQPPAAAPTGVQLPGYTDVVGGGGPSTTETTSVSAIGASLSFVPVVGPVLSAAFSVIAGGLMQASAKRAAAARNENQAVAAAVPGWDKGMAQCVNAYNSGQITLDQLFQLISAPQSNDSSVPSSQGVLWKAYWQEVGPQVQAGRNGCQSGTVMQGGTQSFCGGSYGAGCCVGYDNLKNSSLYAMRAAKQAEENPGKSITSQQFPTVFASKYGGVNRPGYTVTFRKPASSSGSTTLL